MWPPGAPQIITPPCPPPRRRRSATDPVASNSETPVQRRGSFNLRAAAKSLDKRRGSLISRWRKHFSDAADAYNRREGKPSRLGVATAPAQDIVVSDSDSEQPLPETEPNTVSESTQRPLSENSEETTPIGSVSEEAGEEERDRDQVEADQTPDMVSVLAGGASAQVTSKVTADDWPLIQPSQVNIEVAPVHTAQSMLTPLEQIRRKDDLVKQALAEKENLVADMLAIPREHFEHIADIAASSESVSGTGASDITDRLLASVFQVDILQKAVNDVLNVSESDAIILRGGKFPACASQEPQYANDPQAKPYIPGVPVGIVRDIAASLSSQLTTLLSEIKQIEDERDRLRRELHRVREKLHEEHNLHSPVPFEDASDENTEEVFSEAQATTEDGK